MCIRDRDRTSGAAAMLARLLSRGCGKRRAAEVASRLDELGGSLEGVVGRNSFGASAEWLSDSWRDGLELMADCLLAPRLDEVEVASVRRQLLGELAAQATRPGRRALQVFLRALYGGHPYHRDVLGTEQSLARLSRNALRELYQQRFPVSSLALAVVGDVDPDEVVALVSARFASAPRRVAPAVTVTPPSFAGRPQTEREVYAYLDDPAQAHLVVGFPGATVAGPERLPLEVLGAALGGQSGRLFLELRERRSPPEGTLALRRAPRWPRRETSGDPASGRTVAVTARSHRRCARATASKAGASSEATFWACSCQSCQGRP